MWESATRGPHSGSARRPMLNLWSVYSTLSYISPSVVGLHVKNVIAMRLMVSKNIEDYQGQRLGAYSLEN